MLRIEIEEDLAVTFAFEPIADLGGFRVVLARVAYEKDTQRVPFPCVVTVAARQPGRMAEVYNNP